MTTGNNLTIEQMREIVGGAPSWGTHYDLTFLDYYDVDPDELFLLNFSVYVSLADLRTAIAEHDTTDHVTDIRNHLSPSTVVVDL